MAGLHSTEGWTGACTLASTRMYLPVHDVWVRLFVAPTRQPVGLFSSTRCFRLIWGWSELLDRAGYAMPRLLLRCEYVSISSGSSATFYFFLSLTLTMGPWRCMARWSVCLAVRALRADRSLAASYGWTCELCVQRVCASMPAGQVRLAFERRSVAWFASRGRWAWLAPENHVPTSHRWAGRASFPPHYFPLSIRNVRLSSLLSTSLFRSIG